MFPFTFVRHGIIRTALAGILAAFAMPAAAQTLTAAPPPADATSEIDVNLVNLATTAPFKRHGS